MNGKNMYELWRDKELPGNWNERIGNPHNYEGDELAFYSGFMIYTNIDQIRQELGTYDMWEFVEDLESNRLYMADYQIEYENEQGKKVVENEKVVGYYIKKEKMFYGSVFYLYKGRMVGGDTMSFNEEQIKTELKNIREIWNGTFPKNLDR